MSSPCEGSAHPKLFYSVAELTDTLDRPPADVPPVPTVKVVDLPDRPAPRRKTQTSQAPKTMTGGAVPWWVNASPDVALVEPAKNSEPPIVVPTSPPESDDSDFEWPAWLGFVNWKLVGTAGGVASACLMLMVLSAWAASRGTVEVAAVEPMVIKQVAAPAPVVP